MDAICTKKTLGILEFLHFTGRALSAIREKTGKRGIVNSSALQAGNA
jgi:hypothetical protein